jgi:uncharacterized protein (DUF1501 family)
MAPSKPELPRAIDREIADDPNACREYREITRRAFMNRSAAAAGALMAPSWLPSISLASGKPRGGQQPDVLVFCFWRGGPDMLSQLVPYEDPSLYDAPYNSGAECFEGGLRPTIGLLKPDPKDPDVDALRCLHLGASGSDVFGINKAYADRDFGGVEDRNTIYQLFQSGEIAFIPAAGSPDTNRSHFSAEAYIEYGTPNQPHDELTGWLARYLTVAPSLGSPLRSAAFASNLLVPKSLAFAEKTLAFQAISQVLLPGDPATGADRTKILSARYGAQTEDPLKSGVLNAFEIIDLLAQVKVQPHADARYTTSPFAQRLLNAAALIKGGVNVEVVYADRTGWDNHASLGPFKGGGMYDRLKDISQNLAAFRVDLQDHWNRVSVVCQGEFGRQINENGTLGTDHGNGGVMMIMGGNVNGGVYCKQTLGGDDGWPGLDPDLTIDHDAIRTTIDYRAIFAEILRKRMLVDPAMITDGIFNITGEQPPPVLDELNIVNAG